MTIETYSPSFSEIEVNDNSTLNRSLAAAGLTLVVEWGPSKHRQDSAQIIESIEEPVDYTD